jgi:hypothetical protein
MVGSCRGLKENLDELRIERVCYERVTGKQEITREQAGVAKKWQVGGLRAECLFPIQPGESMGYCGRCVGFAGLQSERIFVQ